MKAAYGPSCPSDTFRTLQVELMATASKSLVDVGNEFQDVGDVLVSAVLDPALQLLAY